MSAAVIRLRCLVCAMEDLTSDGRADILVGSPGEDVGSRASAGAVHVVSFAAGVPTSAVTALSLTQESLRGVAETGDQFGYTVAAAVTLFPNTVDGLAARGWFTPDSDGFDGHAGRGTTSG